MIISIILAAGKGTRMKSDLPKVLHTLLNKPMIQYVVDICKKINSYRIITIVGYKKELIIQELKNQSIEFIVQEEQLGTGHAVLQTENKLKNYNGDILVTFGDVPLISACTLEKLIEYHRKEKVIATILTCEEGDPTGYGRIIRDSMGNLQTTVEEKDIQDESIRQIKEVSTGTFVFNSKNMFEALNKIDNNNSQKEYYLPDILKIFVNENKKVAIYKISNLEEIHGINSIEQLEIVEKYLLN